MCSLQIFSVYSVVLFAELFIQAPFLQKVHSAIRHINLYPVDGAISFRNTHPLERDLSHG